MGIKKKKTNKKKFITNGMVVVLLLPLGTPAKRRRFWVLAIAGSWAVVRFALELYITVVFPREVYNGDGWTPFGDYTALHSFW